MNHSIMMSVLVLIIFILFYTNLHCAQIKEDLIAVQEQYMVLPYPYVNPENEHTDLVYYSSSDSLAEIDYFIHGGNVNFSTNYRILVAGGGTGTQTIFLAETLSPYGGEIVYLDFSKASLKIAKRRSEIRNLTNIRFIQDSIYNIPQLNLGKFDYIDCYGVLHHLSNPSKGLKILKDSLKENGGLKIMIYGSIGRTGIYSMQNLLHEYQDKNEFSVTEELRRSKIIHRNLPDSSLINYKGYFSDVNTDHGFYDLYLHKQDQSYCVDEAYEFIEDLGGLYLSEFSRNLKVFLNQVEWMSPSLLKRVLQMKPKIRKSIAEIIHGTLNKLEFFVTKKPLSKDPLNDITKIPYFFELQPHVLLSNIPPGSFKGNKYILIIYQIKAIKAISSAIIPISKYTVHLVKIMSLSRFSLQEIALETRKVFPNATLKRLYKDFKKTLGPLIDHSFVLLTNKISNKRSVEYTKNGNRIVIHEIKLLDQSPVLNTF